MSLKDKIADGYRLLAENYTARIKGGELAPVSNRGRRNMVLTIAYEYGCLDVTRLLTEHPQGWDGPCECLACIEAAL